MTITYELNYEQFLYLRDFILNNSIVDDKQKELLNDMNSFIIKDDEPESLTREFVYNHEHDDLDDFIQAFDENLWNLLFEPNNIVELIPATDSDYVIEVSYVSKIGNRYFNFKHDPNHNSIDDLEEVFPIEIKVKTYRTKNGFITDDHLDIVDN